MKRVFILIPMLILLVIGLFFFFTQKNICSVIPAEEPQNSGYTCDCKGIEITTKDYRPVDGPLVTTCIGKITQVRSNQATNTAINKIKVKNSGGYSAYKESEVIIENTGAVNFVITDYKNNKEIIEKNLTQSDITNIFEMASKLNLANYNDYYGCPEAHTNEGILCPMVDLPTTELTIMTSNEIKSMEFIQLPFAPKELKDLVNEIYKVTNPLF